jgi:hypothetical protein
MVFFSFLLIKFSCIKLTKKIRGKHPANFNSIHIYVDLQQTILCPGGEIGRRTTLRWWRLKGRAGSNPVPGTFLFSHSYSCCNILK